MSESGPTPSPGKKPRGYDQPKSRVGRPIFESDKSDSPAKPPAAAARPPRKPRPSLFELAAPAEHQPAQPPPAPASAPAVHDHVDPALASVSQAPSRRPAPRRRSRSKLNFLLGLSIALISVVCGFGALREAGHIRDGGQSLSRWIKNEILPMPQGVSPTAAIIRPRQYLRLANFAGQPQYSFELWAPDPDGETLVGKYLLAPKGDGAYRLLAAYDVRRQRSLDIPETLD